MAAGNAQQLGWVKQTQLHLTNNEYNQFDGMMQQSQLSTAANGYNPLGGLVQAPGPSNMEARYMQSMPTLNSSVGQVQGQTQRLPTGQAQSAPRMNAIAHSSAQQCAYQQQLVQQQSAQQQQLRNAQPGWQPQASEANLPIFNNTSNPYQQRILVSSPYTNQRNIPQASYTSTPTQHLTTIGTRIPASPQQQQQHAHQNSKGQQTQVQQQTPARQHLSGQQPPQNQQHNRPVLLSSTKEAYKALKACRTQSPYETPQHTPQMGHAASPGRSVASPVSRKPNGESGTPTRRISVQTQTTGASPKRSPQAKVQSQKRCAEHIPAGPRANKRPAVQSPRVRTSSPDLEVLFSRQKQASASELAVAQQRLQHRQVKVNQASSVDGHISIFSAQAQHAQQKQATANELAIAQQRLQQQNAKSNHASSLNGHMLTLEVYAHHAEQRQAAAQEKAAREKAAEQQRLQYQQEKANEAARKVYMQHLQAQAIEAAERNRQAEEQHLERERRRIREKQLRRDESALYRHYDEYLEYFPLGIGERRSQYHTTLLANRRMPSEPKSDLGLAIQYAKENWRNYLQYNTKNVEDAARWQKEKLAKAAAATAQVAGQGER